MPWLALLGDSDSEVSEIARNEILNIGKEVIPFLEDSYLLIESNQQKDALDSIIHKLKMEKNPYRIGRMEKRGSKRFVVCLVFHK